LIVAEIMPQTSSATSSPPPPPRPTLAYSTHKPSEPIVSPRGDGFDGIEIDIPPQIERWRTYLPPRTIGAWVGVSLAALGAMSPLLVTFWWWTRTAAQDRTAGLLFFLSLFVEIFLLAAVVWAAHEVGRRRTTIKAGPDGLTITTVGGMSWPRPRHWPGSEISDLRYTNRIGNTYFEGEYAVLFPANNREPIVVDGLQLLPPKALRPLLAQLRQALALDPPTIPKREEPIP
jgi:hypothetical protein